MGNTRDRGRGRNLRYLGKKPTGTEEGKEVPITEPFCELEAAVGITGVAGISSTRLHVRCTELAE